MKRTIHAIILIGLWATAASAAGRARDLGIPFAGEPGPLNAITDVAGVEVGYATIIRDEQGADGPVAVRTGVTAIHPRGKADAAAVFAARFTMNGDGEMTGVHWIDEFGTLLGPVLLTNTVSVGDVHRAAIAWMRARDPRAMTHLPVVAETWDGGLNDIYGHHVGREHVFAALDGATGGALAEGNVGGGTGMICHGFKAGTGTSSRRAGRYTVGVLVQANHGLPGRLTVAGVPVGETLRHGFEMRDEAPPSSGSSIIVVVATDAPLLPMQLERLAKRPALGIGRVGGIGERTSGEIFLAFSTANGAPDGQDDGGEGEGGDGEGTAEEADEVATLRVLSDDAVDTLNGLYEAVVQATEEAIVNALVAAETMDGGDGLRVNAIDHARLRELLRAHGRLVEPDGDGARRR